LYDQADLGGSHSRNLFPSPYSIPKRLKTSPHWLQIRSPASLGLYLLLVLLEPHCSILQNLRLR
jgi:hypothetical protein